MPPKKQTNDQSIRKRRAELESETIRGSSLFPQVLPSQSKQKKSTNEMTLNENNFERHIVHNDIDPKAVKQKKQKIINLYLDDDDDNDDNDSDDDDDDNDDSDNDDSDNKDSKQIYTDDHANDEKRNNSIVPMDKCIIECEKEYMTDKIVGTNDQHTYYGEPLPDELILLSDTEMVLEKLREMSFDPFNRHVRPPIIMRHMIYQLLSDRTDVDRTIDELIKKNIIRQHILNDKVDGMAYVFMNDLIFTLDHLIANYLKTRKEKKAFEKKPIANSQKMDNEEQYMTSSVARARLARRNILARHSQKTTTCSNHEQRGVKSISSASILGKGGSDLVNKSSSNSRSNVKSIMFNIENMSDKQIDSNVTKIMNLIEKKLFKKYMEISISKENLKNTLGPEFLVDEPLITMLVHIGMLTIKDEFSFWFSIPGLGSFVRMLDEGRTEIIATIKRKKYKEILLKELLMKKSRLKNSSLSVYFHLHAMLGSGICECIHTPNGALICLKK